MKRTEAALELATLPPGIRQYVQGAALYDSSCSETARTFLVSGAERVFLKISPTGSLERERRMTAFLHRHGVAPRVMAYESGSDYDYLVTEAVSGEDGTAAMHLENPHKLAGIFGEYLKMLHALPVEGCPYGNRTNEWLDEARMQGKLLPGTDESGYSAADDVIIHGDYCLPNIIMDHFAFRGFIDLGQGGTGDRHYDLYWGLWTLNYNLKTDKYGPVFLDAYGRSDIDDDGLNYFIRLMENSES